MNKTLKIFFIFLLISLLYIGIVISSERKEEKVDNMKQSKENLIFTSILALSKHANLIISGEVIKIEQGKDKIKYASVLVKEIYKGRSMPVVTMEESNMHGSFLQIGAKGVLFLCTQNKKTYRIIEEKYALLIIDGENLYYKDARVNFEKYISNLRESISLQSKSEIEKNQDVAVEEAKRKAVQLGYNVDDMIIDIDENNTAWNRYIGGGNIYEDSSKIRRLENKDYWAVYFGLKRVDVHDGDMWVFVEKNAYNILFTIPE